MAAVGGMIASAVGKEIASKLGELMKEEIALLRRFEEDVAGMAEKMKDLEAVMSDADDRLRHGESYGAAVGRWLTKFKSIAYDVEDVLDEFNANELIRMTQSKLKLFFSRNNQLLQRMTMTHNMKRVREKIDKIEKEGQTLNLACHEAWEEGRSKNKETFAAIGDEGFKTGMIGRDNEQERIISLLLRSEASKVISVISIVGFGGIGKTTLAQSVFADKRVSVFDVKAWVHVSEKFDLQKIGSRILKRVNNSINLDTCGLQFVLENLEKELATRRYLIVLDDLWEEGWDNLDELKRMLQYGRKGSRIVVTTRNQSVVQTLSTGFLAKERKICPVPESEQINLGVLSPDDCWKLMKQRAMGADCDGQSGLEEIGRQIADKCGGLPLVANSLGQVMSGSRTVQEWKKLRDAKVDLGSGDQKDTLERLMLSYHYMKMEFKMCFTYLAVFSKGFVMDNDRLIQLWKALGYIPDGNTGQRCINYLLGMSFLNIARSSSVNPSPVDAKAPQELSMHDLVHDLALTITANEFFVLDANAPEPRTWNRARYCRHAQLINYQNQFKVFRDLPTKIRPLHFRDSGKLQLPRTSFSRSKCEEEHVSSAQTLQQPDISPLKNLLDATTLEESSITATSSSSPRDTIWHREEHKWGLTFYTRIDLGGSFHTYPHVGGPFQSLQEADNAINRYLHDHRDPKMCMEPNKVSPMEMAIQQSLYRPDGTRRNKPIDESCCPKRQLVHALVDKYNEDHNRLGDLAYELRYVVCFQSIRDVHSDTIYKHINFTTKTNGGGIDNLFFAEVIYILGKHGELVVNCICMVNPSDNGNCYGCANHGSDMKHPNDADFNGGSVKEAYWPFGGFTMDCSDTGGCSSVWGDTDDLEAQKASLRHLYKGMDDPRFMEKCMAPPKLDYGALDGDESWLNLVSFDDARYEAYKQFHRKTKNGARVED